MKRVITLDVLRGIAIFIVILTHVFIYGVDYDIFDPNSGGSIITLIVLSPFVVLLKQIFNAILRLGLQMIIITLALRFYEFNPKMLNESRQRLMLKLSRWIRRWGMFALTIFVFNILEFLPRGILTEINPAVNYRAGNLPLKWTLLMVGILLLLWEGVIRLISLSRGYASIEFVFLALFKFGKKPIKKDPLNLQGNLRDVEPILFVYRE